MLADGGGRASMLAAAMTRFRRPRMAQGRRLPGTERWPMSAKQESGDGV
ncbi:hypothetical protein NB699_003750 [Xanthomonas sacchari]|nr:hypothetical protein [Xanthomonas sacchari]MCW0442813.1 hypothetical protein [Xanthomonas sacchari]